MKKLVSYFFQGLLLVAPVVGTAYLLYKMFVLVDDLIPYHPFPGAGILILFSGVTLLGLIGNTLIATPIKRAFGEFLDRVPLIKTIYGALTDLMGAFVGSKRKFDRPVLVKLSKESNIRKLGFITSTDLSNLGIESNRIAVYLPHSYAFSGNLFVVDAENVEVLNAKPADVMKFIVSGGVTGVEVSLKD